MNTQVIPHGQSLKPVVFKPVSLQFLNGVGLGHDFRVEGTFKGQTCWRADKEWWIGVSRCLYVLLPNAHFSHAFLAFHRKCLFVYRVLAMPVFGNKVLSPYFFRTGQIVPSPESYKPYTLNNKPASCVMLG